MSTYNKLSEIHEAKTMDMLAIAIMLLFAALLFVSFSLPAIKSHGISTHSVIHIETTNY